MFHSIYTIMLTVIVLSILIPAVILKENPYKVFATAATRLFTDKKILFHFFALFFILYFNKIEQKLGEKFLLENYTHFIQSFEGNLVYFIQQIFSSDYLSFILTFFYIIIFPTIMVSSVIVYLNQEDYKSFYNFVYALMLNYGLAIPFFLFFPVYEVWFYDPHVTFLIPEIYPKFEFEYRPLSGISNNFPSLHTSISVSMAIIAMRSKNQLFGKFAFVSASLIVFSTVYLGIHWLSDLAAGVLLAIIASQTGHVISEHTLSENPLYLKQH